MLGEAVLTFFPSEGVRQIQAQVPALSQKCVTFPRGELPVLRGTLGSQDFALCCGHSAGCKAGPGACSGQVGQGSHDPTAHAKSGANIFSQFGENQALGSSYSPWGGLPLTAFPKERDCV